MWELTKWRAAQPCEFSLWLTDCDSPNYHRMSAAPCSVSQTRSMAAGFIHLHWGRHFRLRMKYEDTEEPSQFCSQSTFLAQAVSIMLPQSPTKSHKAPLCRKKRHKSQTRRAFLNESEKLFVILRRTIKIVLSHSDQGRVPQQLMARHEPTPCRIWVKSPNDGICTMRAWVGKG